MRMKWNWIEPKLHSLAKFSSIQLQQTIVSNIVRSVQLYDFWSSRKNIFKIEFLIISCCALFQSLLDCFGELFFICKRVRSYTFIHACTIAVSWSFFYVVPYLHHFDLMLFCHMALHVLCSFFFDQFNHKQL